MLNEKEILKFIEEQKKLNQLFYSNVMDNGRRGHGNVKSMVSAEQSITDMDLRDIETQQTLTDMDLQIMELELGGVE